MVLEVQKVGHNPVGNFGCAVLCSESIFILGNIYPGNKVSHAILSTSQFLTSLLIILKISGIVLLCHLLVTVKLFTHLAHYTRATKLKKSLFFTTKKVLHKAICRYFPCPGT